MRIQIFNDYLGLNVLVKEITEKEISAIDPDSTWESMYSFFPIRFNQKFIWVEYHELYTKKVKTTIRITLSDPCADIDTKEVLSWVSRAIKKGIRES